MSIEIIQDKIKCIRDNMQKVIIGKTDEINMILASLISGGHVLLEDVPGTGKTMLSKALAKSIGADFKRIQFTPDLLPSDLTGINFYNQKDGEFHFKKGAMFTNILLADEINRATPRTQSSLLESMEERQITVDGVSFTLSEPFFVIATQNPVETQGTYLLPEAQLDRFALQLSLGYTTRQQSIELLNRFLNEEPLESLESVVDGQELIKASKELKNVYIHPQLLEYADEIAVATRNDENISLGVSTRGTLMLLKLCRAYAAIDGRDFVTPEDIKKLAPFCFGHRIMLRSGYRNKAFHANEIIDSILEKITVPSESWSRPK